MNCKSEEYELIPLTEQHLQTLHAWNVEEKHWENYTCRPVKLCQAFGDYECRMSKAISEGKEKTYVLARKENCSMPLGKVTLFDFNPRNHSAEFGYYLPANNRGKGLGSIMALKFIETSFKDKELNLNKLYATTSSNNLHSMKLLEKLGFKLDGRLREHYWIDGKKHDQLVYSILKCEWKQSCTYMPY